MPSAQAFFCIARGVTQSSAGYNLQAGQLGRLATAERSTAPSLQMRGCWTGSRQTARPAIFGPAPCPGHMLPLGTAGTLSSKPDGWWQQGLLESVSLVVSYKPQGHPKPVCSASLGVAGPCILGAVFNRACCHLLHPHGPTRSTGPCCLPGTGRGPRNPALYRGAAFALTFKRPPPTAATICRAPGEAGRRWRAGGRVCGRGRAGGQRRGVPRVEKVLACHVERST